MAGTLKRTMRRSCTSGPVLLSIAMLFLAGTARGESGHLTIRNRIILSQLSQIEGSAVLVTGDSIVESWLEPQTGACRALNGGLGGGGVHDVSTLLKAISRTQDKSRLRGIIIAIGVNDTRRRPFAPDYADQWRRSYAEVVDLALTITPNVAIATILPVEEAMPLGSLYFNTDMISRLNGVIRELAREKHVPLIDEYAAFHRQAERGHYTLDGVHPTATAYRVFEQELLSYWTSDCSGSPPTRSTTRGDGNK